MRLENHARTLLVGLSLFALLACEDARVDPGTFVGPAPRLPEPPIPRAADAGAPAGDAVMLRGRVETDERVPILGRPIAVVDARGKRTEVLSDEGGAFYVSDVVRPYDLFVASAPSGSPRVPTVHLGLVREDPFLELFERDGPSERAKTQILRVAVKPPPCEATCSISVVSVSQTGGGGSAASYAREDVVLFEIEHAYDAPSLAPGESIDVHVLTSDAARVSYAHAARKGIRAESGDITDLGGVEPEPVGASAPLTVRALPRGVPAEWPAVLGTYLELPGGASIPLTYDARAEQTLRLPLLAGATMRASAWMQAPPAAEHPYFRHSSQRWTGLLPIAGGTIDFEMRPGPAPARPSVEGVLSARGLGLAWVSPPSTSPSLAEVTVSNVARGTVLYRVWTSGAEVPFTKLERLGLPRLESGDHELVIHATPGHGVDEVVDPDARTRHARFDRRKPGATTTQGFRFRVTK